MSHQAGQDREGAGSDELLSGPFSPALDYSLENFNSGLYVKSIRTYMGDEDTMNAKGIVAFFDILGYQNIIDNNKINEAAKIITDILTNMPKATIERLLSMLEEKNRKVFEEQLKKLDHLLISDSLIFFLPIDFDEAAPNRRIKWLAFLSIMSMFLRTSFEKGLPTRGAIDVGDYFVEGNCFAGKPIVNSYRLSNKLEFSGCILSTKAAEQFESDKDQYRSKYTTDFKKYAGFTEKLIFSCLAPLKNSEERRLLVNWHPIYKKWGETPNDIRRYVIDAFSSHNKDIPRKIYPYIDNTEIILRAMTSRKQVA